MIRGLLLALTLLLALGGAASAARMPGDNARAASFGHVLAASKVAYGPRVNMPAPPRIRNPQASSVAFGKPWLGAPVPSYVRDPEYIPYYVCDRDIFIDTTGTPSGPGNNDGNAFDSINHAFANVSPPPQRGDCFDVVAGTGTVKTYSENFNFPTNSGGSNSPHGWIWIQATDASGNPVDAAHGPVLNSSRAQVAGAATDGSPTFDTSSTTTLQFIGIRGLEIVGNAPSPGTADSSCVNFNGTNAWGNPNTWGPYGVAVVRNYIHDCQSAGVALLSGEMWWVQDNYIRDTSASSPFSASAISLAVPRHNPATPYTGYDAAMPWKIIVSGNYIYNSWQYNTPYNAQTDGQCIIADDFASQQDAGSAPGQINSGLYIGPSIWINNVGFNCGGMGYEGNSVYNALVGWNTFLSVGQELASTNGIRAGICDCGGDYNQTVSNIGINYGPFTQITQSLLVDGPTISVNDVRGVAQFLLNEGNFFENPKLLSPTDMLPVKVKGTIYLAQSYTADDAAHNTCTLQPGCDSGTITFSTNIAKADGQRYETVEPQVNNTATFGCTGPEAVGVYCQFTGFNHGITATPQRGATIVTCIPGSSICDPQANTGVVTYTALMPNSRMYNNIALVTNGGGGFQGLNASAVFNSFGAVAKCPDGVTTDLSTCNLVADPDFTNPDYQTADVTGGMGALGPGFSATPGTLPDLSLIAAISPAVGYGSPAVYPGTNVPFCPTFDILQAPRNCPTPNAGAYESTGAPLAFVGPADVPGVPPPLLCYLTVACSKGLATGRQQAFNVNCNGDTVTTYTINITTAAVLDDGALETACPGWEAGSSAIFTGTVSGTSLTTTGVTGTIVAGDTVVGSGVTRRSFILSQTSGIPGGAGVYLLGASSSILVGETMASANLAYVSRGFEQYQNQRQCDVTQSDPVHQPQIVHNNIGGKDALLFDAAGPTWLGLIINALDQSCGQMFATPTVIVIAERTFGTSTQAVAANFGSGNTTLGFGGANQAYWQASSTIIQPTHADGTYAVLIGVGNVQMTPQTGFISVNDAVTTATFGGNLWDTELDWGQIPGGTGAFTGFSAGLIIEAIPFTQQAEQLVPIALTQTQTHALDCQSFLPNFGIPTGVCP